MVGRALLAGYPRLMIWYDSDDILHQTSWSTLVHVYSTHYETHIVWIHPCVILSRMKYTWYILMSDLIYCFNRWFYWEHWYFCFSLFSATEVMLPKYFLWKMSSLSGLKFPGLFVQRTWIIYERTDTCKMPMICLHRSKNNITLFCFALLCYVYMVNYL